MAFGSRTVARRDVEFNVNLGQFKVQLGEAGAVYARTTNAMSTEALRTSVAQEKVNRAVARFGPESLQARQATVALRHDMESLASASHAGSRAILTEERALGRFSRGALAAAGVSSELKRALLLGSGSFLAGVGVAAVFKQSIDAAKQEEVSLGQLQVALNDTGNRWSAYKVQIEDALQAQVKSTAFSNNELTASLGLFVRRYGDVNKALRANALAADVARARNIGLAEAASLVSRASFGNPKTLRTLQIELTKSTANMDALRASTKHASAEQIANAKAADIQATETAALDAVQARYHGNAAKFLTTTAGKQALFNAELERSKEIIGAALLPTFDDLLSRLARYLDKMNRTGKLQKDVNKVVHAAGTAFHEASDDIHHMETVLRPLNSLLGGTKHTVELLVGALIAFKLRGALAFVQGTKLIGGAAVLATGEVNALTAAEARAAGAAGLGGLGALGLGAAGAAAAGSGVVERVGMYTGAGAAAARDAAPVLRGGLLGRAGGLFVLGDIGSSPTPQHLGGPLDVTVSPIPGSSGAFILYRDPVTGKQLVVKVNKGANIGGAIRTDIVHRHPELLHPSNGVAPRRGVDSPTRQFGGTASGGAGGKGGSGGVLVTGLTEKQNTALLIAQGTKGTSDDLAALRTQLGELDKLLKQKGLKPADLNSLLSQRNSVQDQIDSIVQGDAQDAAERARKAKAKLEAAARKRKDAERARVRAIIAAITHTESGLRNAVEKAKLTDTISDDVKAARALEAFYRRESHDARLSRAMRDAFKAKDVREQVAIKDLLKGRKASGAATEREFLAAFTSVVGDYANNYGTSPLTKAGKGGRPNIEVHFHVPAVSPDRHFEANVARNAMRAAFDA